MVPQENPQTPVTFCLNHPIRGGYQYAKISGLAPMPQSASYANQSKPAYKSIRINAPTKQYTSHTLARYYFCSPKRTRKEWGDDKMRYAFMQFPYIKTFVYCPHKNIVKNLL